jgi:hypothetical protein
LAVELFKERAALVSRETVRRRLHRLGFRWRRPRPVPPEKDSEDQREQKRRRLLGILSMVEQAGAFFQDETRLEINPKVGFCWMRKGKQRPLRTPGTNQKVWISGALNFRTGRFHWVKGERKNDELFMKLLDWLRRATAATGSCTWRWTTTQATPPNGSSATWRIRADAFTCILCLRGLRRAIRWNWCGGRCMRP